MLFSLLPFIIVLIFLLINIITALSLSVLYLINHLTLFYIIYFLFLYYFIKSDQLILQFDFAAIDEEEDDINQTPLEDTRKHDVRREVTYEVFAYEIWPRIIKMSPVSSK